MTLPTLSRWQIITGATLWVLSIQYYVVQIVVAAGWNTGFSWTQNTISDLGNTVCGPYNGALVCSPRHTLMNASFILLGVTMIGGSVLIGKQFSKHRFSSLGFGFMALAGLGTILVGLFPENTVSSMHILGAALPFVFGNLGMILIGKICHWLPRWLRAYSLASGIIGLLGLILFLLKINSFLGVGGMERITAYPQTIWMIIFGLYLVLKHRKYIA